MVYLIINRYTNGAESSSGECACVEIGIVSDLIKNFYLDAY